jgi:hypothetical protein
MTAAFLILTAALATGTPGQQAQAPAPVPVPTAATSPKPSADLPDDRLPTAAAPAVTVEGCVAAEDDVPGRQPNIAERAGLAEDFILTNAKVVKGSAPAAATADASGGVVSNALRPMFEIGGLSRDQLKTHAGRRVRIEGTFDDTRHDVATPLNDDLVQLTGTTIVQIQGACPALPRKSE